MRLADISRSKQRKGCLGLSRVTGANRWYRPRLESLEFRCLLSISPSTIVGRYVFYDDSKFDGGMAGVNAGDSAAIATDKSALLPNATSSFANVTSYAAGIDGIMVDISGAHGSITASDFIFRVGNNNAPASWAAAPTPSAVSVLSGGGAGGSDRMEVVWPAGSITKKWLEVIVDANTDT
ncbi:MAG TPA: hypothetical protein VHV08_08765, partial [Pirellulales bacterium]|nr:hypothetical protein [Pirellulales bacterium]